MRKFLTLVSAVALMTAVSSSAWAFAQPGAGKSAAAPGQAKAIANCSKAIGQTPPGDKNSNPNDAKQGSFTVTNCDHFFN